MFFDALRAMLLACCSLYICFSFAVDDAAGKPESHLTSRAIVEFHADKFSEHQLTENSLELIQSWQSQTNTKIKFIRRHDVSGWIIEIEATDESTLAKTLTLLSNHKWVRYAEEDAPMSHYSPLMSAP